METDERIQLIQEARELVIEARMKVDKAIQGTSLEAHYDAYGKYGFNQLLNNGNPYDYGLDELEEELPGSAYDDEEDD